jgi:hypothetical protein
MDLRVTDVRVWTEFFCLSIGTGGGFLWTLKWAFGYHKIWWISFIAEWLLASPEGLYIFHGVSWLVYWTQISIVIVYLRKPAVGFCPSLVCCSSQSSTSWTTLILSFHLQIGLFSTFLQKNCAYISYLHFYLLARFGTHGTILQLPNTPSRPDEL